MRFSGRASRPSRPPRRPQLPQLRPRSRRSCSAWRRRRTARSGSPPSRPPAGSASSAPPRATCSRRPTPRPPRARPPRPAPTSTPTPRPSVPGPAELQQSAVRKTVNGWTVEFTQSHRGVPVFAAELRAHVDAEGDLTSVNGFAVPGLDLDVTPRVSKADAAARALRMVGSAPSGARGDVDRLRPAGREQRAHGLPDGHDARRRGRVPPGVGPRGDQRAQRARERHPRREHRQAGQPLVDGGPRARRASSTRSPTPGRTGSGRRATSSPGSSTRTSRTRSSVRVRPTGCSRTPSTTTATTAPARR